MSNPKFIGIENHYINRSTIRNVELIENVPAGAGKIKIYFITGEPVTIHYPLIEDALETFSHIWIDLRKDD